MNVDFMNEAFKCAKMAFDLDEVPIGAVIVKDNMIISSSFNKKESMNCCIAHAEILAIKEASNYLNNWRLDDCDISFRELAQHTQGREKCLHPSLSAQIT